MGYFEEGRCPINLYNCSHFFQSRLMQARVTFLFPAVWRVLAFYYQDKLVDEYFVSEDTCEASPTTGLPENLTPINSRDQLKIQKLAILELRLVCRAWRDGIDHYYQHLPEEMLTAADRLPSRQNLKFSQGLGMTSREYHYKFLRHHIKSHGSSGRSPFVGRSVSITVMGYHHVMAFEGEVLPIWVILKKYGHHVWYCTLHFQKPCATSVVQLSKMLSYLPNLRSLRIIYGTGGNVDEADQAILNFPKLAHLRLLDVFCVPTGIFRGLVKKAGHLRVVQTAGLNRPEIGKDLLESTEMAMLEEIALKSLTSEGFKNLRGIEGNWPLCKLFLRLKGKPKVDCGQVFRFLKSKWGHTLTQLDLSLVRENFQEGQIPVLELAKLKRLKLVLTNVPSVDFITPLHKSLEDLEIEANFTADWTSYPESRARSHVHILDQLVKGGDLRKLFGKLKKLSVKMKTRKDELKFLHWTRSR